MKHRKSKTPKHPEETDINQIRDISGRPAHSHRCFIAYGYIEKNKSKHKLNVLHGQKSEIAEKKRRKKLHQATH